MDHLGHVKCPTLVMHGKKDPVIQLYHPQFITKNIPHCVVHMFDEGGHLSTGMVILLMTSIVLLRIS